MRNYWKNGEKGWKNAEKNQNIGAKSKQNSVFPIQSPIIPDTYENAWLFQRLLRGCKQRQGETKQKLLQGKKNNVQYSRTPQGYGSATGRYSGGNFPKHGRTGRLGTLVSHVGKNRICYASDMLYNNRYMPIKNAWQAKPNSIQGKHVLTTSQWRKQCSTRLTMT